jgi:regulator of protease activity HflC (stomatin/prohibitin superfamily)
MTSRSPNDTRYTALAFAVGIAIGGATFMALSLFGLDPRLAAGPALVLALAVGSSIKYADQWERAVILRLGRFHGLRGPGFYLVIPIVDRVGYNIDQRIRTSAFNAESCLTRDTVPVNVDAIAFWLVGDVAKAALEVQDFEHSVIVAAQAALRDAIGKHDLAELIQTRTEMGEGLKKALDAKMHQWGVQVQSVEIRDVIIPQALEDAMSREAQAERERRSRIILGTAETEIASKFVEAAEKYRQNPMAMNLRAMNMLYESIAKRGSLMVVPSGLADSLNVPGFMGMASAAGMLPTDAARVVTPSSRGDAHD